MRVWWDGKSHNTFVRMLYWEIKNLHTYYMMFGKWSNIIIMTNIEYAEKFWTERFPSYICSSKSTLVFSGYFTLIIWISCLIVWLTESVRFLVLLLHCILFATIVFLVYEWIKLSKHRYYIRSWFVNIFIQNILNLFLFWRRKDKFTTTSTTRVF